MKQKSILLEGELTIQKSEYFKSLFNELLNDSENINVTFGEVEAIDISFLQLLYSLKISAEKFHIPLQISAEGSAKAASALKESGFERLFQ